jgi:hypothetical protein
VFGSRLPAQQAVQRLGHRPAHGVAVAVERRTGERGADGLLEPGGRLAGRSGEGDPETSVGLVCQQGEQPRDRGRLAGARPAGQHRRPLPGRRQRGRALLGVPIVEQRRGQSLEPRLVDHRRRQPQPGDEVVAHLALLAPVAVEVEDVSLEPDGPDLDEPARGHALHPTGARPRQPVGQRLPDEIGQIEADGSVTQRPHRQGEGERDLVVGLGGERLDPVGGVGV